MAFKANVLYMLAFTLLLLMVTFMSIQSFNKWEMVFGTFENNKKGYLIWELNLI